MDASAVVSWAGMRGVVTLAAAFLLPASTPQLQLLQLAAFTVVAGTLLLQGSTLPWLIRRLGLTGPDPAEDALQAASLVNAAAQAGLQRLERVKTPEDLQEVIAELNDRSARRSNALWERLGRPQQELETSTGRPIGGCGWRCSTPSGRRSSGSSGPRRLRRRGTAVRVDRRRHRGIHPRPDRRR